MYFFFYRRWIFVHSYVTNGRPHGARGDYRHHSEFMRFSRSVHESQGVQQPFAAQPVRRRQYGVHY